MHAFAWYITRGNLIVVQLQHCLCIGQWYLPFGVKYRTSSNKIILEWQHVHMLLHLLRRAMPDCTSRTRIGTVGPFSCSCNADVHRADIDAIVCRNHVIIIHGH